MSSGSDWFVYGYSAGQKKKIDDLISQGKLPWTGALMKVPAAVWLDFLRTYKYVSLESESTKPWWDGLWC